MFDYTNLIAVFEGVPSRTPVAPEVYGFDNETLSDLTFLHPDSFPILRLWVWWPGENIDEPLGVNKKYGQEVLVVIPERKVVTVYHPQLDMTPEEIQARDDAIRDERKQRIEYRKQSYEPIEVAYNGDVLVLDTRNKYLVTDMRGEALGDEDYESTIKLKSGNWVELSNTQIKSLASIVRKSFDDLYRRQKALDAAVDDWTFTDAMLDEGWPSPTVEAV